MRGRVWLAYFVDAIVTSKNYEEKEWSKKEWTDFLRSIMLDMSKEMYCCVFQKREVKDLSYEYLGFDSIFISKSADIAEMAPFEPKYDPFVLPLAVVEYENEVYDLGKISYDLWKLLCIRAKVRVLICYANGLEKIESLKDVLQGVIWRGGLMKGTDGDLLVIIGDDGKAESVEWEEYFHVFEWRSDKLERINDVNWEVE